MSSWGNLDNVAISGTVTAFTNNTQVNGSGAFFTANVDAGDYIIFAGRKYQVDTVVNDNIITITSVAAANVLSNVAYIQQGPKWIANANIFVVGTNVNTIQNIYGVDRSEIANTSPAANATPHVGWVYYNTYTTTQGETRRKAEVLVAMSKNFNANATGHLQVDASDDTIYPEFPNN